MSIRKLIEGETIKLCNHHRGQERAIDDSGLHLDKRFNVQNPRRGRVNVRITIADGVSVTDENGNDANIIIRELREAFEDRNIREGFIRSTRDTLADLARNGRNLDELHNSEELKQRIDRMLIGLTRYFGRSEEDISTLLYHRNAKVAIKWETQRNRKNNKTLYAEVDFREVSVTLTRNRRMVGR